MSLFSKTVGELDALVSEWDGSQADALDEQIEVLTDLATQDGHIDLDILTGIAEAAAPVAAAYASFASRLTAVSTALRKFVSKAEEGRKNPEQAIYGPAMLTKIDDAGKRMTELEDKANQKKTAFEPAYEAMQRRMTEARAKAEEEAKQEAERKKAEEARAAAEKAEAERVRQEQEKAAAAAAEAKAKEEAAAAAAAAAAEDARKKTEAEEQARAAAAERERLLAERRATESREAAERASAAERERLAREAADAQKPLAQRCKEQMDAALAELKSNTFPSDLAIALQTLQKFLSNIMSSPHEERFRQIRLQNDVFQKRLGGKPGGLAALKAMGFEPYRTPSAAQLPPGSELKPDEDYLRMDAKAELWPVLVQSKAALEEAIRQNRAAEPAAAGAAGTPSAAAAGGAGAASPFGAFPFGGMGAPGGGASPFAGLFGAPPAGGAPGGGAGGAGAFNPLTMLSDPFVQQIMSSPSIMSLVAQQMSSGGGQPTPEVQQRLMGELMSNPQLMQSMMQSPMLGQMMADPQRMAQMSQAMQGGMGASPFASMFGGMPPVPPPAAAGATPPAAGAGGAANPFAALMSMMGGSGMPPAGGAAGQQQPFSPFNMFQQAMQANANAGVNPPPAAAPPANAAPASQPAPAAAAPAPAAAPAASPAAAPAAAAEEEEVDEEALLQEAMRMSMAEEQGGNPPAEKKD